MVNVLTTKQEALQKDLDAVLGFDYSEEIQKELAAYKEKLEAEFVKKRNHEIELLNAQIKLIDELLSSIEVEDEEEYENEEGELQ